LYGVDPIQISPPTLMYMIRMMCESLFFSTRNESALSRPKHEYIHRESFETDNISTERERERERKRENKYMYLSFE
jgi:hypothetical protein